MTWMISAIEQVVVREERLRVDTKFKKAAGIYGKRRFEKFYGADRTLG